MCNDNVYYNKNHTLVPMWQQLRLRRTNVDFASRRGAQRPKQEPETLNSVRDGRNVFGVQQLMVSLPSDDTVMENRVRSSRRAQGAQSLTKLCIYCIPWAILSKWIRDLLQWE